MNQKQQKQQEKQGEKDALSSLTATASTNNSNNSSNNNNNNALLGLQQRLEDLSTGKSDNANIKTNNNTNNNTNNTNVTNIVLKDNSTQQNTNTNHKNQHKKNLPLCIKNILSPNAKIKSDRKSNYLYRHSQGDKCDTNLLLCLHGAGDTHIPYYNLVKQMNIPQCATLCIHASAMGTSSSNSNNNSNGNSNNSGFVTLPFGLGYTWFEEMDYKTTGQTLDINDTKRIHSLHHASENIDYLIDQLIHNDKNDKNDNNDQGWIPERIFLLGFSAGACLAMNVCYNRMQRGKRPLGGVICIAGGIKGVTNDMKLNTNDTSSNDANSNDRNSNSNSKELTPLLLMGGSNDKMYSTTMLKVDAKLYSQLSSRNSNNSNNSSRSKNEYDYNRDQDIVKIHIQPGKGHEMVNQKEEIQCMMQFFADNMVRRMIAIEGWSEVSSFST